uniref:Amine oxidase domain-containing protein n=1 Tax=Ciona intestinalis TaxID=7719 RepID=F6VRK4_CIOIN
QAAQVDVIIIGGGPTGLGAAYRVIFEIHRNLCYVVQQPCCCYNNIQLFAICKGYKTLSSHYEYFDKMIDAFYCPDNGRVMETRKRNNFVYIRGKLVKYPVQSNLGGLPVSEKQACVMDLVKAKLEAKEADKDKKHANLDEFLVSEWGETLCNLFFRPYIFKSWAYPTGKLRSDWVQIKIPPADLSEDLKRVMNDEYDIGWGTEAETMYPSKGGLVGVWRSISKSLPKSNVRFKNEISELDIEEKKIVTKGGLEIKYKQLISTMPLTSLLELSGRSDLAENMVSSSLFVVCLGVRGATNHTDVSGCIYYPESDTIFHRACVFSNYDPDSLPPPDTKLHTIRLAKSASNEENTEEKAGPYWSLMLEVSGGPLKTIQEATVVLSPPVLVDDVIRDACSVGLLRDDDEIVSIHLTEMTHGYPLPTIGGYERVDEALRWLKAKDIWSRGRFGAFKYEAGDLDHCLIQGVEAVDNMLKGIPERCIREP